MVYEKFKTIVSYEEYFSKWTAKSLEEIDEPMQEYIYNKYVVKCIVFQDAGFKCENKKCTTPYSKLTYHHIKHKRNGGKITKENGAAICNCCHGRFNSCEDDLDKDGNIVATAELVIGKITYRLDKPIKEYMKERVMQGRVIRKQAKADHGYVVSYELLLILLDWLGYKRP